jgi:hypothetical protein
VSVSSLWVRVRAIPVLIVVFVSVFFSRPGFAGTEDSLRAAAPVIDWRRPVSLAGALGQDPRSALMNAQAYFERNDGQVDGDVLFLGRTSRYSIFLTRTGVTIALAEAKKGNGGSPSPYFRLTFENANAQAEITGVEQLPGISNYFHGSDPKHWHTRVPQFARVRYAEFYPGIDLIFYFQDGQLEYDLAVSPGADLSAVHFRVEGATAALTADGAAAIKIDGREVVRWARPQAYQEGVKTAEVPARYRVHQGELSLAVNHYDRTKGLVIDPALIFATYMSSNCINLACGDTLSDLAADNTGAYLTGTTGATIFPATAGGPQPTSSPNAATTFVVKVDPTGSHVLYSTFLDGSNGYAIAVDGNGFAYVSGLVTATGFPLTSGVFSGTIPANSQGEVAYATKLSADGSSLVYSTLLELPGTPSGLLPPIVAKIAVDSTGALYITGAGSVNSLGGTWAGVPVSVGAYETTPGSGFLMKLTPNASGLDYATYIDGPYNSTSNLYTAVTSIAVDGNGDAFVAGTTNANTFPTTAGAYETTSSTANQSGGFVLEMNPGGTAPIYATLFGSQVLGTGINGLTLDSQGEAIATGGAADTFTPTAGPSCGSAASTSAQGFVVKFTANGSALVYLTTLCGSLHTGLAVSEDSNNNTYVYGFGIPTAFLPLVLDPIQGYAPPGTGDTSIAVKMDASANLEWATFVGANNEAGEAGTGSKMALDGSGNVYIMADSSIPPTPNALGPAALNLGVGADDNSPEFVLKIAPSLGAPVPLVWPNVAANPVNFYSQSVGTSSAIIPLDLQNYGDAAMSPVISITPSQFTETDNCSGSIAGGQMCTINVTFTPTSTASVTGSLTISFGGNIPSQVIPLSGNGTASAVSVSPSSLTFGTQATGTTSGQQTVTVTNNGTGSLTVTSVQTSAQFGATNTCGAPIPAVGTCTIQVTFTPTSSGAQTGTLTINDNAPNSPQTVSLSGNQAGNFTIAAPGGSGSTSTSVSAGQTATYGLSVSGSNGFSGAVNFTCSGAPSNANCTVSPNPANVSGTTAVALSVSVTTQAASSVLLRPGKPLAPLPGAYAAAGIAGALAFLLSVAFGLIAKQRRFSYAAAGALTLVLLGVAFAGCGGGSGSSSTGPSNPGTPAGSYTLTVTGTSGSISQTTSLALTVK